MNSSSWAAKPERGMRGELHEKNGQPIKEFVCHVDDKKAVKGFK